MAQTGWEEVVVAWLTLLGAGLLEIVWAFAISQSKGFTRLWPTVATVIAISASVGLLSWSARSLPIGTAYTVWTGIGSVGTFAVGIIFLGEPAHPSRVIAATLIVGGLLLMKASTPA